jgi:hypothetical protein
VKTVVISEETPCGFIYRDECFGGTCFAILRHEVISQMIIFGYMEKEQIEGWKNCIMKSFISVILIQQAGDEV